MSCWTSPTAEPQLGLTTAVRFLPIFLFGPLGGVFADRMDKRRVLYLTQTLAGLLAGAFAVLVATGSIRLWVIYLLALAQDGLAAGKELAALDEHQVRSWTSWRRWTILALLAHAFLSVLAATQPACGHAVDDQLVPLTRHEIRRLFTGLCQQLPAPRLQLHWSRWRRRHQAIARACHYRGRTLNRQ